MATAKSLVTARLSEIGKIHGERGFNNEKFSELHDEIISHVNEYPFCDREKLRSLLNQKFNLFNHWNLNREISKMDEIMGILKTEMGKEFSIHLDKAHNHIKEHYKINKNYRNKMYILKRALSDSNPAEMRKAYKEFDDMQRKMIGFDEKIASLATDGHRIVSNSESMITAGIGLLSLYDVDALIL